MVYFFLCPCVVSPSTAHGFLVGRHVQCCGAGAYKSEEYAKIVPPEVTQSYVSGHKPQEDRSSGKSKKPGEDWDETLVSWGFVVA